MSELFVPVLLTQYVITVALLPPLYPSKRNQLQRHLYLPCTESAAQGGSNDPMCQLRMPGLCEQRLKCSITHEEGIGELCATKEAHNTHMGLTCLRIQIGHWKVVVLLRFINRRLGNRIVMTCSYFSSSFVADSCITVWPDYCFIQYDTL